MTSRSARFTLGYVRWLALSGLVFVASFALAVGLYGSGAGSDPADVAAYYATGSDRLRQIGGFAALLAGCIVLLVYVVVLVRDVVADPLPSTIALVSGISATLLLATANALWAASAFTAEIESNYQMNASTHLLIEDAGFAVVVTAMAVAIPFVVLTSFASSRTRSGRLPAWFRVLGAVAVAGLAAAYWYWPIAAFLVWILCGSVLLTTQPRHRIPAAAAAPAATTQVP